LSKNRIPHLLKLAGVSPADRKAATWLSEAIEGARPIDNAAIPRPLAVDHNELLADIEKSAKELTKRIERLRRYPFSRHTFWRSKAFGPVYSDRVEVREVLSTLETIVLAAEMAKDRRRGRRRETGKQHVVDLAFGFFERFSPRTPSGTPTGAFASFAREFYSAAIGSDPAQHGGLDRQIRQAARSSVKRQPTQRKSVKKPRHSS
jgi:hypothetical protein